MNHQCILNIINAFPSIHRREYAGGQLPPCISQEYLRGSCAPLFHDSACGLQSRAIISLSPNNRVSYTVQLLHTPGKLKELKAIENLKQLVEINFD